MLSLSPDAEHFQLASFGIYFPKFVGTLYDLLSAPVSYVEVSSSATSGTAKSKSVVLGLIILATAALFVPFRIVHPFWMIYSWCPRL